MLSEVHGALAGGSLPHEIRDAMGAQQVRVVRKWPSEVGLTYTIAPMAIRSEGSMLFDLVSLFSVPVFYTLYWERRLAREAEAHSAVSAPQASA